MSGHVYGTCVHVYVCVHVCMYTHVYKILSLSHSIDLTQYLKEARGLDPGDFSKNWAPANAFWEVVLFSIL